MKNDQVEGLDLASWPVPDEYLVELGRLTALWAGLESFMSVCIGKLAGFNDARDPRAFILVAHMSFPQKLDILGSLCEQLAPEHPNLHGYRAVISKLKAVQEGRNRFVHHGMSVNPDSGAMEMAIGSARGKLKTHVAEVRLAEIRRVAMEIHLAQIELYALVLKRRLVPVWEQRVRK